MREEGRGRRTDDGEDIKGKQCRAKKEMREGRSVKKER